MINSVESYSISFFILLIILISIRRQSDKTRIDNLLFTGIILINMALLFFDLFQSFVDKQPGTMMYFLNNFTVFVFYLIGPFLSLLWLDYVDYFIHKDRVRLKKIHRLTLIPMIIFMGIVILSLFVNAFFYIDSSNTYFRGILYWPYIVYTYSFALIAAFLIIKYRKEIRRSSFYPMLFFVIPPIVGGIIQAIFYGLLLVWPMTMISVFMVFVFVQSQRANTDYLTNLFNKREFDNYINVIEKTKKRNYCLAGIFADLDQFKMINDQYGHYMGDLVLKETALLLLKSFDPNDFIARIGGDEFAVIFKLENPESLQTVIQTLNDNFTDFNQKKKYPFEVNLSFGALVFDKSIHGSINEFVKKLDELMYKNKNHLSK